MRRKSPHAVLLLPQERMQAAGFKPKRNVFVLFVPDEEMSGVKGMQKFVASPKLKEINAGLALDEGLANPGSQYTVRAFPSRQLAHAPWHVAECVDCCSVA